MRSLICKSMVLAGAFVLVAGALTKASAENVVEVKVPFPFVVHGKSFPAGQYMIQRDDTTPSVLLIRGEKGNHAVAYLETIAADGQDPDGTAPALMFKLDDEHQYRLSSVWESDGEGRQVTGQ